MVENVFLPFLKSFSLFGHIYLGTVLLAFFVSPYGILLVGRNRPFLPLGLGGASALGVVAGLLLSSIPAIGSLLPLLLPSLFAVLATLFVGLGFRRRGEGEYLTVLFYLLPSSLVILLLSRLPYELKEVEGILSSQILTMQKKEVLRISILTALSTLFLLRYREEIFLLLVDPEWGEVVGVRRSVWDLVLSGIVGIVSGFSIRLVGIPLTFAFLLFPVLTWFSWIRIRTLFWLLPFYSSCVVLIGFFIGYRWDLSPGPLIVLLLGIPALLSEVIRRRTL